MKPKKVKVFEHARGFYGRRKNIFTVAIRAVHRAWQRAYISRKQRARNYRENWIQQTNIAARQFGMTYSQLVRYMPAAGIDLNRKVLSDLATTEPYSFRAVVEAAKQQMIKEQGTKLLARNLQREPEMR